jgi:small conductance mechanosensitive channel
MNEQAAEVSQHLNNLYALIIEWGPKVVGAIVVLVIGLWVVKIIARSIGNTLEKRKIDASLRPFLKALISTVLKVLVIVSVMGMVGIEMTSFIAIIGAAGLAIGLALSGALQHFAGGVMILIFKPIQVGDFIEAQGFMGTVKEIGIFTTVLNTVDNKTIFIPNGPLSTNALTNFSKEPLRRVDWKFGVAYGDDMENFKAAIHQFISEDSRILQEPSYFTGLSELADSSVNFDVRAWVEAKDYWGVYFDMNEKVYKRFADYKLNIPFPQLDIHLQNGYEINVVKEGLDKMIQ